MPQRKDGLAFLMNDESSMCLLPFYLMSNDLFQEVDRRPVISSIEALAADQERDRARAQNLLSAFDDSDEEDA